MIRNIKLFFWLFFYLISSQKLLNQIKKTPDQSKIPDLIAQEGVSWGSNLIRSAGGEVTVVGEEKLDGIETVCFISNHQSYFDIPIMLGFIKRPKAFLAKVEILKVPILSKWMQLMHCVFIDRKNIRQSVTAIREATTNLIQGTSMVVFPEGTRAKDGVLGEFKSGGFKMAVSAGVPIVPIAVDGAYKFFEGKKNEKGPVKVRLVIGDPIVTAGLSKIEIAALPDKVKEIIANSLTKV